MLGGLARQQQCLAPPDCPARCRAMEREIALYFAAFLSEKQRKQEIGAEASPEKGEQPGPSAWPVTRRGASVPRQELRPDLYVPVLDACQAGVDVASLCIAFRG